MTITTITSAYVVTDTDEIEELVYPESDGLPMSENTEQYDWIVLIKENLEILFADQQDVFIAADLFWYPVRGQVDARRAPDVFVVLGRPKGRRGAYLQWREGNIAPQVVVEILSLGNTLKELARKFCFYDAFGVLEYYLYDPEADELTIWQRNEAGHLRSVPFTKRWRSAVLGIEFDTSSTPLVIRDPHGEPFLSSVERAERERAALRRAVQLAARAEDLELRTLFAQEQITQERTRTAYLEQQAEKERIRAEQEHIRAEQEHVRAEQERTRAEQEHIRAEQERIRAEQAEAALQAERDRLVALAAQLQALGVDAAQLAAMLPDQPAPPAEPVSPDPSAA